MSTAGKGAAAASAVTAWRGTTALALACAGWAAIVLLPFPTVRVLVPAAFLVGIVAMARWPVLGATVICLGQAAGLALGAPADSPAGLVAGLSAMVVLGRRGRLPLALLPVAGAWVVIVATDVSAVRQILGLALFGAAFGVAYTLRRTTERTEAAEAAVRELETVEVAARAREALEAERHRLTAESARLLAAATREMQSLARAARDVLDTDSLSLVRSRGNAAVDELRALLGVLRDVDRPEPPAPARSHPRAPRPDWHVDIVTASALWSLDLLVWGVVGGQVTLAMWDGLTIAAVALRRRAPTAAAVVATSGLAMHVTARDDFVLGPALAVAVALVVWSAVGSPTGVRLAALVPLAAACILATAPARDGSLEVTVAILLGAGLVSHLWHRLEATHARASAQSDAYARRVQVAVATALEHERLGVARDLHDLASGAIAVMMLHTSVAEVTRKTDPDAARDALDCVVASGDAALEQLRLLEHALGPDAGGATGIRGSLDELVERAREAGLDCRLGRCVEPRSRTTAAVVWRVVNEALTNALKHAPRSRVDVGVHREGAVLVVQVRDDGAGTSDPAPGTRLGLRGLSELVARESGSLRYGPVEPAGTGFELEARLPDRGA